MISGVLSSKTDLVRAWSTIPFGFHVDQGAEWVSIIPREVGHGESIVFDKGVLVGAWVARNVAFDCLYTRINFKLTQPWAVMVSTPEKKILLQL